MNELPNGWTGVSFGHVFDFKGGSQPPKATFSDHQSPGYVRLLQIRDFESDAKAVFIKDHPRWPKCSVGDIMIGRYGASVGKILTGKSGAYNVALVKMIFEREFFDPSWVRLFLLSDYFQEPLKRISRSAQNGFNKADLEEIEVPLPPFPEQRRIVAKIDSLSAKSKRARDQLDHIPRLVEKYKQAILAVAFSDSPRVALSDLVDHIQYGYTAKSSVSGIGSKYLRITDIQHGDVDWSQVPRVEIPKNERSKFELEKGDLVFARSGATVGKSFLISAAPEHSVFASYLIRVRCDRSRLLPKYAAFFFQSEDYWRQIAEGSSGTGQPNFNGTKLGQLQVPSVPILQQQDVVYRVEKAFSWIERLSSEATSARKLIEHLDQAVLAKAFRGELVPQDPNEEPASVLLERIQGPS